MKTYELTYIVSSELTAVESEIIAKKIESFIQENKGVILKREGPIVKRLSYAIGGKISGFFNILELQSEPEKIKELKEKIEKEPKIIRYMLLTKKQGRKIKEGKRKFKFIPEVEIFKTGVLNKEELSFLSPFTSTAKKGLTTQEFKEDKLKDKKIDEEKQEKVELKDIEKRLDELLNE